MGTAHRAPLLPRRGPRALATPGRGTAPPPLI
jgi:hypothetical protein